MAGDSLGKGRKGGREGVLWGELGGIINFYMASVPQIMENAGIPYQVGWLASLRFTTRFFYVMIEIEIRCVTSW